jgi:carboxyl-terminal processing protease
MENEKKQKNWGLFVLGLVIGLLVALIITSVIYKKAVSLSDDSLVDSRVLKKIESLESTIHDRFYLSEVTDEELEEGIYRGLLEALDDPYSEYYTAEELTALMDQTEGVYYGIGAYVGLDTETSLPKISGTIEGAPAEEAGLRPDDLIYKIDDESAYGLSLTDAVALIKGPEGTEVTLTIIREGESDYLEISIPRRKVESPTVEFEMLEDNIAYIEITEFDDVTVDQFADALATAKGSGMEGLILDLRGNPGGSLSAVVNIAGMMLPEGLVVYTEDKEGNRSEYRSDGTHELQVPLVVLVDGNSASASEILAGAIQDYELGTLVGTTTFGKGIVQQIIALDDGSAIKLTISSYFTPNGRNIHGTGIEPDVECEFDGETYYNTEDHYDNQLEKAKEVLKGLL